jgi:endonuclease/exonuclease/phosphatase family metal-dependent hydrolase
MFNRLCFLSVIMLVFCHSIYASSVELMSYNVENLFDTSHDAGHADYEYLPTNHPAKAPGCAEIENDYFRGKCYKTNWSDEVLEQKINAITEVVYRDGQQTPDILGLVEIENIEVANILKNRLGYTRALITDGLDQRGINVALLVRESKSLKYVSHKQIEVSTSDMRKPTRNVLHVKFSVGGTKYLNVFVNHWPSQNNPSRDRENVAKQLVSYIEDLTSDGKTHFVAIMGDFNVVKSDNPHAIDEVILTPRTGLIDVEQRFRKSSHFPGRNIPPSSYYYKRGNSWNYLDKIIVSSNLFDRRGEEVDLASFDIFAHPKYSRNMNGERVPVRFEINNGRTNGVSDHYPVSVKLKL